MELDLEGQLADRAYPILASLVTPRPIALVTTISPQVSFLFLESAGCELVEETSQGFAYLSP
jgi:hypothetical protein